MVEVRYSGELADVVEVAASGLVADPVANNVALSIVDEHRRRPGDARLWWIEGDGGATDSLAGYALQGRPAGPLLVSRLERRHIERLVGAVAGTLGDGELSGVNGEIGSAMAFAAAWAQRHAVGARVAIVQRYYSLDVAQQQRPSRSPAGGLRLATAADTDVLVPWAIGFQRDVFGRGVTDVPALTEELVWKLEQDEVWVWEDDRPLAMTAATRPVGATSRIQHVYTPPEHRGRGLAAACVAGVVDVLATEQAVEQCVLFTDLANPTSNAVYQRLGFVGVEEQANVEFDR